MTTGDPGELRGGALLRTLREERDLSRAELAQLVEQYLAQPHHAGADPADRELLGRIDGTYFRRWEEGGGISDRWARVLAAVLQVDWRLLKSDKRHRDGQAAPTRPADAAPQPPGTRFLPPAPDTVGRQAETDLFDRLLDGKAGFGLLNIYGPGGIGKTVVCRKLLHRARQRGAPVGLADCGADDAVASVDVDGLSPYHVLDALQQALVGSRPDLRPAFSRFETLAADYELIRRMRLVVGGSAGVLGGAAERARALALAEQFGAPVTEQARRAAALPIGPSMDLYLRSAAQDLTREFAAALGAAREVWDGSIPLLVDTYEEAAPNVDRWMCAKLIPTLPPGVVVVILGRKHLAKSNFMWRELEHGSGSRLHARELPELSEAEAREYLGHHGLTDPNGIRQVLGLTGGYPMLLLLVRQLAEEAGGWEEVRRLERLEWVSTKDGMANQLLGLILREASAREVRIVLERCCVATWLDPDTIRALLGVSQAEASRLYDAAERHSFVDPHRRGIRIKDHLRELLEKRLELHDNAEHQRLVAAFKAHRLASSGQGP